MSRPTQLEDPGPDPEPGGWPGRLPALAAVALVLCGVGLRFLQARDALFYGDEWHTIGVVSLAWGELVATFDRFGTGVGYPLFAKLAATVFGDGQLGLRVPALAAGAGTIVLTWWCGRRFFGAGVGATAAALVALNGFSIFYAGFARSYTLVCALALCLAAAVGAWMAGPRRLHLGVVVVTTALLPYVHLTALALALSVVGAGLFALVVERRWRSARALGVALLVGLLLAVIVHVPAWDGVVDFVGRKHRQKYKDPFSFLDVATLFLGTRGLTWAALVALPIAMCGLLTRRGRAAWPWVAGALGPVAAVAAVRPFGDAYAYARYAIAALPFLALVLAWGLFATGRRFGLAQASVRWLGLVLAAGTFALGPMGIGRRDDGVFANAYTSFYRLPAFERDYDRAPEVYRTIAADPDAACVLELPHLIHRGVLMYRSYGFLHGRRVRTGFLGRDPALTPAGYPTLVDPAWAEGLDADWVVLHLDAVREAEAYFEFVAGVEREDPARRAYMERLTSVARSEERPDQRAVQRIRAAFGEPVYRDRDVIAWRR